jgi:hypothetical protein
VRHGQQCRSVTASIQIGRECARCRRPDLINQGKAKHRTSEIRAPTRRAGWRVSHHLHKDLHRTPSGSRPADSLGYPRHRCAYGRRADGGMFAAVGVRAAAPFARSGRPDRSRTWSWKISSPQLLRHASACPKYRDVEPAQHACAADPDRQRGLAGQSTLGRGLGAEPHDPWTRRTS